MQITTPGIHAKPASLKLGSSKRSTTPSGRSHSDLGTPHPDYFDRTEITGTPSSSGNPNATSTPAARAAAKLLQTVGISSEEIRTFLGKGNKDPKTGSPPVQK